MGWDQYSYYEEVPTLLGRLVMTGKKFAGYTISIHENPVKSDIDYSEPVTVKHVTIAFEDGTTVEFVPKCYRSTNTDDTGYDYYQYYPKDEVVKCEHQSFLEE